MRSKSILLAGLCALSMAAILALRVRAAAPLRVIEIKAKKFEFSPDQLTLKKRDPVHLASGERGSGAWIFPARARYRYRHRSSQNERHHGDAQGSGHLPGDMRSQLRVRSHGNMNMTIVAQ